MIIVHCLDVVGSDADNLFEGGLGRPTTPLKPTSKDDPLFLPPGTFRIGPVALNCRLCDFEVDPEPTVDGNGDEPLSSGCPFVFSVGFDSA
jgi:hypothetical protein